MPPSARPRASDQEAPERGLKKREEEGACLFSSGCHTVLAVKAVRSSRLRRSCTPRVGSACSPPSPDACAAV
jgi:hypothetical protein